MNLNFRLFITFLLMLMLSILPVPDAIIAFRPSWVLLLVLYIQIFLPEYFRITWLFLLGLCLDVLLASIMGEHAFALVVISWLCAQKARRFVFYSISQQAMLIGSLCLLYQIIIVLIDRFLGYQYRQFWAIEGALAGLLFWPGLQFIFSRVLYVNQYTAFSARSMHS